MGDAYIWRRMMVSFKSASKDLYVMRWRTVARHIASQEVDPVGLSPLLNNRLIPLSKNPGRSTTSGNRGSFETYYWQVPGVCAQERLLPKLQDLCKYVQATRLVVKLLYTCIEKGIRFSRHRRRFVG